MARSASLRDTLILFASDPISANAALSKVMSFLEIRGIAPHAVVWATTCSNPLGSLFGGGYKEFPSLTKHGTSGGLVLNGASGFS